MAGLLAQARKQFGDAIKGFWFLRRRSLSRLRLSDRCHAIQGPKALSLNTFIYRPRGMLIGYFLCNLCAQQIFKAAERNPGVQIPLHGMIERNLITAYQRYLASQDA